MKRLYRRRKKRKLRGVILLAFTPVVMLIVLIGIEIRVRPVIAAMAESRARNIATETVNDAIKKVLCTDDFAYEKLCDITRDELGNITSVTVDTVCVNTLCASIRGEIVDSLSAVGEKKVSIPIGTLTGIDIFTGRGPKLNLSIALSGSATTNVINDFQTAGINQTRHISKYIPNASHIHITTKIYIILQSGNISTEIENSIVVAETVIVGPVPEIYSDGTNELWQNLI